MLRVSSSMTSINLSSNQLGGSYVTYEWVPDMTGIKAIADALSVSSSMTFVDLSSNLLTRGKKKDGKRSYENDPEDFETDMTSIKAIADALSVSTSLNYLK